MAAVRSVADEQNLVIRKERKSELFLEIWSFTPYCNWLDIVEIRLHEEPAESSNGKGSLITCAMISCRVQLSNCGHNRTIKVPRMAMFIHFIANKSCHVCILSLVHYMHMSTQAARVYSRQAVMGIIAYIISCT